MNTFFLLQVTLRVDTFHHHQQPTFPQQAKSRSISCQQGKKSTSQKSNFLLCGEWALRIKWKQCGGGQPSHLWPPFPQQETLACFSSITVGLLLHQTTIALPSYFNWTNLLLHWIDCASLQCNALYCYCYFYFYHYCTKLTKHCN